MLQQIKNSRNINPDPEFPEKKNEDPHLLGKASIHPSMNSKKRYVTE
jgi:hypothetical protein